MARTIAALPAGARITDYISLGVITSAFPAKAIRSALTRSGKGSIRERELPAHVVISVTAIQRCVERARVEDQRHGRGTGRSSPARRAVSATPDALLPRLRGRGW